MKTRQIKIGSLPEKTNNAIKEAVSPYCVCLAPMFVGERGEEPLFIASGTLIQVQNIQGILTAQHVVTNELFKKSTHLGILLKDEYIQKLPRKRFVVRSVANPVSESKGPDLAIILFSAEDAGWPKAFKRFYNIDKYRDDVLQHPLDEALGAWAVCGCPAEAVNMEENSNSMKRTICVEAHVDLSGLENTWEEETYDYADVSVRYDDQNNIPTSFEGLSGGGLWQVPLSEEADGSISVGAPILSGVAFYQTAVDNDCRSIRCHFRKSIYRSVYDTLTSQ
ncbi:MAG: hypothetical protein KAT58_06620 [candidate division Zixibacteria bacterium]|nr:hypothetical protein [candidate division Zixibacteria bacterium]